MMHNKALLLAAGALALALAVSQPSQAQQSATDRLIGNIVNDVVHRTLEAAREEVRWSIGVDPTRGGYGRRGPHKPMPSHASDETRRELWQLDAEHDRRITELHEEFERKVAKAQAEFEREAAKEDKPEKIEEKGRKLDEKISDAQSKYEEKMAEEERRFEEKRVQIMSK